MLAGAALGLGGCSQDYALYKVDVQLQAANGGALTRAQLDTVAFCQMTITDERGETVLQNYPLQALPASGRGCASGQTQSDVGNFSYSTSRTSGSLTFKVTSYDDANNQLETGTSPAAAVKPFHVAADEISVTVIAK
jgi:hypothetical protein